MNEDRPSDEQRLIDLRLAMLETQYGEHLNVATRDLLRERLQELHGRAEAVRRTPLTLDDEPLPRFMPRPAKDRS